MTDGITPISRNHSEPTQNGCCPYARDRRNKFILLALLFGMSMGASCVTCAQLSKVAQEETVAGSTDRVGVVELNGPIMDAGPFIADLRAFQTREDLLGLVIRIDSPGGAVAPSQEIYQAIRRAADHKPVVVSMGTVAASGGFWAAMAADHVFALPGSLTGSIGVVMQGADLRGLADLLRVKVRTYKSGELKDIGNPFREATAADEALIQDMLHDIHAQFLEVVQTRRRVSKEAIALFSDGRVMTGAAAKKLGLIDELGSLYDAARKVVTLARKDVAYKVGTATVTGVGEDPTLVYPKHRSLQLFDVLASSSKIAIREMLHQFIDELARTDAGTELRFE